MSFCFSVPYACSVGPTVCRVTDGRCTSARDASLTNTCCSMAPRPCPPYSLGQPTPIQPSAPICLMIRWYAGAVPVGAHLVAVVVAGEPGEVGASLLLERPLLGGQLGVLAGGLGDRHVGERGRPAQVAGDVADPREVAPAAGRSRRRPCRRAGGGRSAAAAGPVGEPVRGDGQVVVGRVAGVETADDLVGGQRERAGGDVDVGDLLGDGLELRERAAELAAVADVAGGQVAGAFDHAGAERGQAGDGVAAHHVGVEHAERGRGRERVGGLGRAARRAGLDPAHAGAVRVDDRDDVDRRRPAAASCRRGPARRSWCR